MSVFTASIGTGLFGGGGGSGGGQTFSTGEGIPLGDPSVYLNPGLSDNDSDNTTPPPAYTGPAPVTDRAVDLIKENWGKAVMIIIAIIVIRWLYKRYF